MPRLAEMFHSAPLGVAASSVLFGLAHWNFDVSVENAFLLTLQTFYGFCFALCYLLFDGPGTATLWDGTTADVTLTAACAHWRAHAVRLPRILRHAQGRGWAGCVHAPLARGAARGGRGRCRAGEG
ncbi:EF-hand domain-containing protein [Pseudoscourfieldia marina]